MAWNDGSDEITGSEDLIDSREVIARIEYLNPWHVEDGRLPESVSGLASADVAEFKTAEEAEDYIAEQPEDDQPHLTATEYTDEAEELKALTELAEEASGYAPDWSSGETLIADAYFETYAQDLAEDTGAISREASWPLNRIDWEAAADDLKVDYASVDYRGWTFWIR